MNLRRASKSFWVLKMFLPMRLVFGKQQLQEQWEAVKDSLNVVVQRAVRSGRATATKTTSNAIANAIQKYQLVITKPNDLFVKFMINPRFKFLINPVVTYSKCFVVIRNLLNKSKKEK